MNIIELKSQVGTKAGINLATLMLSQQKDEQGVDQPWLSHWDNDKRVRIVFPEDVAKKVQENKEFDGLAYKMEVVPAHENVAEYTRFVVIIPTSVVMTL